MAGTRFSQKHAEWCYDIFKRVSNAPFLTVEIPEMSVQKVGKLKMEGHVVRLREDRETTLGYIQSIYKLSPSGLKIAGWWNS